ncbi:hypothetical protein Pta02_30610 [Planobispora takensis]|uniref:Uncharacterized protein n=1 Tax=Planobispora takensis TaxID=1367882 RepID=A0A8J3SYH4_9ACTN|nr:hypothetical protein Pta02_30610 [Planobispora takensis]
MIMVMTSQKQHADLRPTPEHGWIATPLSRELHSPTVERDRRAHPGKVDVRIDDPRDPVEPDFVPAPAASPRPSTSRSTPPSSTKPSGRPERTAPAGWMTRRDGGG